MMNHMITIGQLAAYAGVTIKAVRHYHQRGLLAEPPRDSSGYRRYSARHAIDLVKIKTLAEAGPPSFSAPASGSPSSAPVTGCSSPPRSPTTSTGYTSSA